MKVSGKHFPFSLSFSPFFAFKKKKKKKKSQGGGRPPPSPPWLRHCVSAGLYHHTGFSPYSLRQNVMGSLTCKRCMCLSFTRDLHFTSYPRDGVFSTCTSLHLETEGEAQSHVTLASSQLSYCGSTGVEPRTPLFRRRTLYPLSHIKNYASLVGLQPIGLLPSWATTHFV